MRIGTITASVAFATMTLAACGEEPPGLVAMKIELTALKQELEYLRQQTEDLDPRVRNAEQMALQVIDERQAPLRLDCEGHRPGVLTTRLAPITAICEGVTTTADGTRVSLRLGNPTSAQLDGVGLTVYAGEGAAVGQTESRTHLATRTSIPPGRWSTVEVDLPVLHAHATQELALRATIDAITLAQR